MADIGDSEGDLADVRLLFHNYSLRHKTRNTAQGCVYVGESLRYDVVITKPKEILFKDWQRRVSQLSAHACVSPIEKSAGGEKQSSRKPQPQEKDDAIPCTEGEKQSSRKPKPQEKDDAIPCTEGEKQSSRKPQPQEKDDAILCTGGENQSSRKPQPQEKDDAIPCTEGEKQSNRKPQPHEKDDAILCTEGENKSSRKPQPQEKDDAIFCTGGENRSSRKPQPHEKDDAVLCSVITTYIDTVEKKTFAGAGSIQKEKLYFQEGSSCVIPMSTCVGNTTGQGQRAELCVTLWLSTTPQPTPSSNPKFHASDDKFHDVKFHADDAKVHDDESNLHCNTGTSSITPTAGRKCVEHKTVTRPLRVRDPPYLKVQFVSCGQQHLLLVQVHNGTGQTVTLKNLTIVPSSSSSSDPREFFSSSFGHGHRERCGGADSWQQVVSLALSGGGVFPVMLAGCEQLALIYRLDLSAVTSPVELAFHSYLRWTHPDTNKEITTVFRLPRLRVRYPAFTVTVKCEGPVETGKTFYLTYNIANNLQDFLSVRLYWSLDSQLASLSATGSPDTDQERSKLEAVKRSIICHDPDIFIGSCPRGCSLPVSVGFQILQPGLYEFGELMKLNLRWALPDSQSTLKQDSVGTPVSTDTVSTLSADDQLLASTELWRDRSGSTCSLQTPTSTSAEERRKTFATKSYSFGDLGPTQSADSDDACRMRFKSIKRSSAVLPPRPPPPGNLGHPEKELANRNNFLKKSFKIYIPSSC